MGIRRQNEYVPIVIVAAVILVVGLGAAGWAVGASKSSDAADAAVATKLAYDNAYRRALTSSQAAAREGAEATAREGASTTGRRAGARAGKAQAEKEIADDAAAAQQAEADANTPPFIPHGPVATGPLITLPNGSKGWALVTPSLSCVGIEQAPPHRCVGD